LRDFPILEAAHGHELTDPHIDHLRKLDSNYENSIKLRDDQQFFIDTAASCSFAGFVVACEYWFVMVDPDGNEPKDQLESSTFRVSKGRGGRGELKGQCDAVTAQAITTAVDHEAEKLRHQDKQAGCERTESQRRMAALATLVKRGFARQDGTYPVPLANIVMSQQVLDWALTTLNDDATGAPTDPIDTVPVHPHDVDGRCELIDGTPIHPFLAVHALGLVDRNGTANPINIRRYVLDANSRALDVSVNARIFPQWIRTTAIIETRGQCATHGCDAPHGWLQTDHIQPSAHGGQTRHDNAQPQCRPDNQAKGATPNQIPWRHRTPPKRRNPRRSQSSNGTNDGETDKPDGLSNSCD